MKKILFILVIVTFSACKNQEENLKNQSADTEVYVPNTAGENIYQFKVKDIRGNEFDFAKLKGKKILVVNTASKCGLTPQYEQLEALYDEFKGSNFVIVGFPSSSFLDQEPGSNEEIAKFCTDNYGVTFPMMEKISVKGDNMHELYQFLTKRNRNGLEDNAVQWNFQKYLINEQGHLDKIVSSQIVPIDESIISWIKS